MRLFKNVNFQWWQVSLLKLSVLAIGMAIGAYWSELFAQYAQILVIVGVVIGLYIFIIWSKQ